MSAIISSCGLYRYRLERNVGGGPIPLVAWIMVNPSTADAETDDATIRKVVGFTERMGADRAVVGNKFAFRATDVRELRTARDPIGEANDTHLVGIMEDADEIVVAWGPLAKLPKPLRRRWRTVAGIADTLGKPLMCFGTAQDGHPRHPLMLAYDTPLTPWKQPP